MQVKNKTIVITGTTRGMGRSFCERIAVENPNIIMVNRKSDSAFEKRLKDLGAKSVTTYEADLSDLSAIEPLIAKLNTHEIDILFNNAGTLTGGLLETQDFSEVQRMLNVNVSALIHLTHAILPQMLKRGSGKIVNHSSIASLMYFPCTSTYSATKAAVLAFTESLRKELKGTGVSTLVLITPGVKTEMIEKVEGIYENHSTIKIPKMETSRYVELIYEAIRMDLTVLKPQGFTGLNLKLSKYLPKTFDFIVEKTFKR